jgi:hypothetical protein
LTRKKIKTQKKKKKKKPPTASMKPLGRYFVLLPVALATVSFVLSMLGIFAGHKPGFMEDYAVVRVRRLFRTMPPVIF